MHELMELKEMLCKELEEYGSKGELTAGSLEIVDKLAHAVKNLGKIIEMYEDEEGYSMERYSRQGRQGGGQGGNRGGGNLGGGRQGGGSSNRGYSREGSYRRRRDRMGRYSSEGDIEELTQTLGEMMGELPEEAKREAEKLMMKLEEMM